MPCPAHLPLLASVLVFDWDDTLLCSSWLASNGFRLDYPDVLPASVTKQLEALQGAVVALLKRAQQFGKVMIITNAETGWVELSCKRFIPEVLPHLADLDVFSARSNFESLAPDSPSEWKVCEASLPVCDARGWKCGHWLYAGRFSLTRALF